MVSANLLSSSLNLTIIVDRKGWSCRFFFSIYLYYFIFILILVCNEIGFFGLVKHLYSSKSRISIKKHHLQLLVLSLSFLSSFSRFSFPSSFLTKISNTHTQKHVKKGKMRKNMKKGNQKDGKEEEKKSGNLIIKTSQSQECLGFWQEARACVCQCQWLVSVQGFCSFSFLFFTRIFSQYKVVREIEIGLPRKHVANIICFKYL